ncbi:hypothetical protein OG819_55780 [Streptomyces sp. NBC_01549]|nr:hypothetical protein [Streptomyces sp. NBC_01549]
MGDEFDHMIQQVTPVGSRRLRRIPARQQTMVIHVHLSRGPDQLFIGQFPSCVD